MLSEKYDINETWIHINILDSIYLNDDNKSVPHIPPFKQIDKKLITLSLPEAKPLPLRLCGGNIVDQILDIMLSRSVRKGSKRIILPFLTKIKEKIQVLVEYSQPISFVLPTLPFKDQSPFGTNAIINHVDLGEYCFFAQIKRILQAIKSIYHPGAHMTLLCDGYIYADIFVNDDKDGAGKYKVECERIKNAYGLHNDVTLLDMREIFFRVPNWKNIEKLIRENVWKLYKIDQIIKQRLDSLARRFIYYVKIPNHSYEEVRMLYENNSWPCWVWEILLDSAIKYASIHLTMKKTNLVTTAFPFSIRCTIHPKASTQLPLHVTNSKSYLLPYNGVATVSRHAKIKGDSLFDALKILRFFEVLRYENICAVYTNEGKNPFYYEIN